MEQETALGCPFCRTGVQPDRPIARHLGKGRSL